MRSVILCLSVAVGLLAVRCTQPADADAAHWSAYKLALGHGDLNTAIAEVNAILARDTLNVSAADTLLRLYFVKGNFVSAWQVGKRIPEPDGVQKNLLAKSALKAGKPAEAKRLFLELDQADSTALNLHARYRLASLHFNDKEYELALDQLNRIVKDEESMELSIPVSGDSKVAQNVPLYAASFNFAGFVFLQEGDLETAETYFNEALRVMPDFQLASNNLELLAQKKQEPGG